MEIRDLGEMMSTMNPQFKKLIDIVTEKEEEQKESLNQHKVNLIVAGKTGTGKSTLINVCFRKKMAETGIGRPVTQNTQLIEDEVGDIPLRIHDTVGLELTESTKNATISNIHDLIEECKGTDREIHCVWYCVLAGSNRFEQPEEDLIANVSSIGVPVILVLTQAFSKERAEKFRIAIKNEGTSAKKIQLVLAEDFDEFGIKAYGKDNLIKETAVFLSDDKLKQAWINASSCLELKHEEALKKIYLTFPAVIAATSIPIPIADEMMLVPIQLGMMAKITSIYGLSVSKSEMIKIGTSLLGVSATTIAGKALVGSIMKFIPTVGSVVGGVINATTAVTLTYALGRTYIYIMEWIYKGNSLDSLDNDVIRKIMKENMATAASFLQKRSSESGDVDFTTFESDIKENDRKSLQYDSVNELRNVPAQRIDVEIDEKKDGRSTKTNIDTSSVFQNISGFFKKKIGRK